MTRDCRYLLCIFTSLIVPALCLGQAPAASTPHESVVFTHVNLIPMDTDRVLANQTLVEHVS